MTEEMLLATIEESTEIVTEPVTTQVETVTETLTTAVETITETITTTVSSVDYSKLADIDVDLLNRFLYVGTSFIIACLFWFVVKLVYKLFNMFF